MKKSIPYNQEYQRLYYLKNKEIRLKRSAEWFKNNPEKVKEYKKRKKDKRLQQRRPKTLLLKFFFGLLGRSNK